MKIHLQNIILLVSLLLMIACKSQMHHDQQSEVITQDDQPIDNRPRIDSILQFTLMITDILEDSKGNYWFGTHGDGICRYDGEVYTYYTVNRGLPIGKVNEFAPGPDWSIVRKINSGNQIAVIQEDHEGNIWILTGNNDVCRFDGQRFQKVEVAFGSKTLGSTSNKSWQNQLNDLWFPTWGPKGIYRFDGLDLINLTLPQPFQMVSGISEIFKDSEDNIWFGTMDYGVFRFNGKVMEQMAEEGICRSIFQDRSGRIWVGLNRVGLFYLDGDTLKNFTLEYESLHGPTKDKSKILDSAQSIEQDSNGDIWFGSFGGGLWRYDGLKVTHIKELEGLPIHTIKTIYKDKDGELWYGIGEGSVYGYNGNAFYRFDGQDILHHK